MKRLLGTRRALLLITLTLLVASFVGLERDNVLLGILSYLVIALSVLFLISSICRCQALNWSAWRVLLFPIPFVGLLLLLELLLLPARERVALNNGQPV